VTNPQELIILKEFTGILEQLDIDYAIGGSMASSIYGKVRFTQDADITVQPFEEQGDKLFETLKDKYYISRQAMQQALTECTSFNIIHLEYAFKIDIFVRKDTDYQKQILSRRKSLKLSDEVQKSFSVLSPEDIILLKLQWYQDTGCTSGKQWDDVLGILAVQADRLDYDYLKTWSQKLQISDLLQKAVAETKDY